MEVHKMTEMILETKTLQATLTEMLQAEKVRLFRSGSMITIMPVESEKPTKWRSRTTAERLEGYTGDYKTTEWDTGEPVGREVL